MAQETAVSWLKDKLKETYDKEGKLPLAYTLHLVEQAKQMEKEQIINAFGNEQSHLQDDGSWRKIYAEQYYNETYGGQGSPDTTSSHTTQNK